MGMAAHFDGLAPDNRADAGSAMKMMKIEKMHMRAGVHGHGGAFRWPRARLRTDADRRDAHPARPGHPAAGVRRSSLSASNTSGQDAHSAGPGYPSGGVRNISLYNVKLCLHTNARVRYKHAAIPVRPAAGLWISASLMPDPAPGTSLDCNICKVTQPPGPPVGFASAAGSDCSSDAMHRRRCRCPGRRAITLRR